MERVVIWLNSIYFLYFLIGVLVLLIVKLYMKTKILNKRHKSYVKRVEELTSNDGEAFVKSVVDATVKQFSESFPQTLHNVIFKKDHLDSKSFRQIDHLIISVFGILAIETKFYSGTSYIGIGHDNCFYTKRLKTFFPNLLQNEAYSTQYSTITTVREYKNKNGDVDIHYEIRKSTPLYQVHTALKELYKISGIDKNVKSYKVAILVPSELNYISERGGNKASLIDCRNLLKDKNKEYVYALGQDELRNHIKKFLTGQLGDIQFSEKQVEAYVNKLRSI